MRKSLTSLLCWAILFQVPVSGVQAKASPLFLNTSYAATYQRTPSLQAFMQYLNYQFPKGTPSCRARLSNSDRLGLGENDVASGRPASSQPSAGYLQALAYFSSCSIKAEPSDEFAIEKRAPLTFQKCKASFKPICRWSDLSESEKSTFVAEILFQMVGPDEVLLDNGFQKEPEQLKNYLLGFLESQASANTVAYSSYLGISQLSSQSSVVDFWKVLSYLILIQNLVRY